MARSAMLPSAMRTASAPEILSISRLNGWAARYPADASPAPSRMPAHGSGPMRFAIPSSWWTLTIYSLPVSRRTLILIEARPEYLQRHALHSNPQRLKTAA